MVTTSVKAPHITRISIQFQIPHRHYRFWLEQLSFHFSAKAKWKDDGNYSTLEITLEELESEIAYLATWIRQNASPEEKIENVRFQFKKRIYQ
jgi:hypothetical protein